MATRDTVPDPHGALAILKRTSDKGMKLDVFVKVITRDLQCNDTIMVIFVGCVYYRRAEVVGLGTENVRIRFCCLCRKTPTEEGEREKKNISKRSEDKGN